MHIVDAANNNQMLTEAASKKEKAIEGGEKKQRSVLQAKLTRLTLQISYAGSFVAVCSVLTLIIRFIVTHYIIQSEAFSLGDLQYFASFIM